MMKIIPGLFNERQIELYAHFAECTETEAAQMLLNWAMNWEMPDDSDEE